MKKRIAFVALLVFCAAIFALPASAAAKTFTDTLEDNYPLVDSKSEWLRFENNKDLGATFYEKVVDPTQNPAHKAGDPTTEEWAVWKVNGDITGFKIETKNAAGLGNSKTDIRVELSKDGKTWTEVKCKVSDQTFDPEIYLNKNTAYWFMSDVTNDGACAAGNAYLKVTILPFTAKGSVPWNTVLDTVIINYNESAATQQPSGGTTASQAPAGGSGTTQQPSGGATASRQQIGGSGTNQQPTGGTTSNAAPESTEPTASETPSGTVSEETPVSSDALGSDPDEGTDSDAADSEVESGDAAQEEHGGLPVGAIVGIIVGAAAVIAAAVFCFLKFRKAPSADGVTPNSETPSDETPNDDQ